MENANPLNYLSSRSLRECDGVCEKCSKSKFCPFSRAEKMVDNELKYKGITTYLPLKRTLRQWSDRKKWVEEPLFRSYIFLYVNRNEYYKAVSTRGIVRFVSNNGKPLKVSEEDIATIKNVVACDCQVELVEKRFDVGARVIIVKGCLTGASGILVEYRGKRRIAIMLDSIGYALLVEVMDNQIQLLSE